MNSPIYRFLKQGAMGLVAIGWLSASALAVQPITTDSRIKTFVYNANEVFNITTHYGYQSNIEFGLRETIETVSVGDRVGWQIIPSGRRMFIRAMEENAHTNMTVVTNQRAYQFDLRSSSSDAVFGSEQLTYVVRFFYPDDVSSGAPMPVANAAPMAPAPAIVSNNLPPAAPALPPQASSAPRAMPAPVAATNMAVPVPTAPVSTPMAVATAPTISYAPPSVAPAMIAPTVAPAMIAPTVAPAPASLLPSTARLTGQASSATPAASGTAGGLPSLAPVTAVSSSTGRVAAPAAMTAAPAVNYRYTFSGPEELAPVKIYDDGRSTYFKMNGNAMPQIAVITTKGETLPVAGRRTNDGLVAVDVIAPRFSLNQKGKQVLVYNESAGGQ
jgi:type IV secretion system protein VirB9